MAGALKDKCGNRGQETGVRPRVSETGAKPGSDPCILWWKAGLILRTVPFFGTVRE
jgi:hypothetical protein